MNDFIGTEMKEGDFFLHCSGGENAIQHTHNCYRLVKVPESFVPASVVIMLKNSGQNIPDQKPDRDHPHNEF